MTRYMYAQTQPAFTRQRRNGSVLLIVLVVVVILSLSAYTFSTMMVSEFGASRAVGKQVQTRALLESGVEAVRLFLAQEPEAQTQAGGLYDNPEMFQGVMVVEGETPEQRGRFSVVAPALDEEGIIAGIRFGLEDESTRLNLNTLMLAEEQLEGGGRTLLMALPGMTEDIADSILDWIDPDDEPREYGAEIDYYSALDPPYAPTNGPLGTVEELLLVRGVQPQLLFGLDLNRNGIVDPFEANGSQSMSGAADVESTEGEMDRGWSAYLTLFSKEKNLTSLGLPRIYINNPNLEQLMEDLRSVLNDEWANFIIAYRLFGPYTGGEGGESAQGVKFDLSKEPQFEFSQSLQIIDIKVQASLEGESDPVVLKSPINSENLGAALPLLMDNLTINKSPTIPGRININQAPRAVLMGIPGLSDQEDVIDEIIQRREPVPSDELADVNRKYETWILAEGIVDLPTMQLMLPFVNVGGDVYRAQVVGYFQDDARQSRSEVTLDATSPLPRILFWRDLSHLPQGYPTEVLGADFADSTGGTMTPR